MDMDFNGRAALVTGGSSGLGLEISKQLLEQGAKVVICGRDQNKLEQVTKKYGFTGFMIWDVSNISIIQNKIKECELIFGQKIDILVNNAGIFRPTPMNKLLDIDEKHWDEVMDINLKGTFFIMQNFIKYYLDHKIKGNILNVSSCAAYELTRGPYYLSKLGVVNLTKSYGIYCVKQGIIINGIAPGVLATPINGVTDPKDNVILKKSPSGYMINPRDISCFCLYLLSPQGRHLVGETVVIDDGWSLRYAIK